MPREVLAAQVVVRLAVEMQGLLQEELQSVPGLPVLS